MAKKPGAFASILKRAARVPTEESQLDAVVGSFKMPTLSPEQAEGARASIAKMYEPGGSLAYVTEAAEKKKKDDDFNARFGDDSAWLDPEFELDPTLLGESAGSNVYADPNLVESQQRALDQLFGIADDGGATAQERARRAGARRDSEGWLRGQREADMQDLAERGMGGSGAELLTLGKDRADAAGRLSAADLETDAWLEQRALDAVMGGGALAGQMRDTDVAEKGKRAAAADEFTKINNGTLNKANESDTEYKRQAYLDMIRRRTAVGESDKDRKIAISLGLLGSDIDQGKDGLDYTGGVATGDVNTTNAGTIDRNAAVGVPVAGKAATQTGAHESGQRGTNAGYGFIGSTTDRVVSAAAGGAGGGGAGAGAGAGAYGGGDFNWNGIAQGVASDDDDEKKVGSYA